MKETSFLLFLVRAGYSSFGLSLAFPFVSLVMVLAIDPLLFFFIIIFHKSVKGGLKNIRLVLLS
jgi:hypothetical protein